MLISGINTDRIYKYIQHPDVYTFVKMLIKKCIKLLSLFSTVES